MGAGAGTSPACRDRQEGRSALSKSFQMQAGDVMITGTHIQYSGDKGAQRAQDCHKRRSPSLRQRVMLTAEHAPLCSAGLTENIA